MVRNKKFCIMSLAASVVMFSCTSEKNKKFRLMKNLLSDSKL